MTLDRSNSFVRINDSLTFCELSYKSFTCFRKTNDRRGCTGTFCVSYDQELADGRRVRCYGYNSMYATLSSGREVVSQITDPESFQTRTHTAPDGTELTIMRKDNEAFLYVYLLDSFFEMHIHSDNALSDADVDAIADNLNYSNIGK